MSDVKIWRAAQAGAAVARVAMSSVGNYAAVYALVFLVTPWLPLERADAVLLASCLSFPMMVAVALWSFAERRLWLVAAALAMPILLAVLSGLQ